MNKKTIYIIILMVLTPLYGISQSFPMNQPNYDYKQWHFGFTLGGNGMNFITTPVDQIDYNKKVLLIEPVASQGINIGIVANKRLVEYLDLRFVPTLSFGERKLRYKILEQDTIRSKYLKTIESTFIDFPLTLKYKSKRLPGAGKNSRVYVLGGMRYSIDLASQKNKRSTSSGSDVVIKLKPNDLMFTTGVGFDFYFQWFKFGIELQMSFGLVNILYQENNQFTSNIDKLTSKMTWITFTFE